SPDPPCLSARCSIVVGLDLHGPGAARLLRTVDSAIGTPDAPGNRGAVLVAGSLAGAIRGSRVVAAGGNPLAVGATRCPRLPRLGTAGLLRHRRLVVTDPAVAGSCIGRSVPVLESRRCRRTGVGIASAALARMAVALATLRTRVPRLAGSGAAPTRAD